jgi:CRISPR-associated protein Cst2
MSLHLFANFVTTFGVAANNRGDNQGAHITPLQKLVWMDEPHTTVSAEAIRFALRRCLKSEGLPCNRNWAEHLSDIPQAVLLLMQKAFKGDVKVPCGYFIDPEFSWYKDHKSTGYADDDLLGFMSAEAAKEEAEASELPPDETAIDDESERATGETKDKKKKVKKKGTAFIRRAVLEVTRAISLTPWTGDVSFNAASPGATPSAQKKGSNPVPYGTEMHATRYQYGVALTPERLRDKSRAAKAIESLCNLGTVAGNHGRFLFDFSPDAVVFRITQDPAPRMLYCFSTTDNGKTLSASALLQRVASGDLDKTDLILGVTELDSPLAQELGKAGLKVVGVKAACNQAVGRINERLGKD